MSSVSTKTNKVTNLTKSKADPISDNRKQAKTTGQILHLQRTIGNQAVNRLIQNGTIQQSGSTRLNRFLIQREGETGLASQKRIAVYAGRAKDMFDKWNTFDQNKRQDRIKKIINIELGKLDLPPMQSIDYIQMSGAEFNFQTWSIDVELGMTTNNAPTPQEAAEFANSIYHESRHSEQWFRMARMKAGDGWTSKKISTDMYIPTGIAAKAAGNPLRAKPSVSGIVSKAEKEKDAKTLAEAKEWWESIYGANAANRNAILDDIDNRYQEYKDLKEEIDAWAVGDAAGAALLNLLIQNP